MSNTIALLETMGQDATLAHADPATLAAALASAGIDPAVHAAILVADRARIEAVLGAQTINCCVLFTENREGDEVQEDEPSTDKEVITQHHSMHCIA